jgi:outer membrane receptor for ferrienterochelin and colicins
MKNLTLFIFLILSINGFTQKSYNIKDAQTGKPIAFANVMLISLNNEDSVRYCLSDEKGFINTEIKSATIFHISYVGYKTIVDTVAPNQTNSFEMKPDVFNMDAFVVTASCEPQLADKSIYNIQVVSSKEIISKGANNLTELLNNELNMKINIDPSLGAGISIQGLSGEHVKILVDGVPLVGRKNGNLDLSQINLNNVDHVEVIEGPMSVVYGSNALAGVINIITRKPNRQTLSVNSSAYYESVGVYNIDGGVEVSRKRNSFRLSAARNFFDGYTQTPELRSMDWKPKRQLNGNIGYSFHSKKHKLNLDFSVFDELLLDKGNLMAPYYETAFDQYFYTTRTATKLDYLWKLNNTHQLKILNSFSTYNWRKNTYLKDLTTLDEQLSANPQQQDSTLVYSYLSRGIFSNDNSERKINYQIGYDFNIEQLAGKRIVGNEQAIGDFAAFVSLNYTGIKNFKFQPGLRYSYNTKYSAPLVYSLNGHFQKGKFTVRASAAKGFRAPSIKELFLDFQDINHNINGNPDLKAEYSKNFNVSVNYVTDKKDNNWSIKTSAYYNQINNIITLALQPNGAYTYTNLYRYVTKGMDLGVKYSFYPRITLDLTGGFLGILNDAGNELTLNKFLYSPSATANIEFFFKKANVRMNTFYKYTGRLPQVSLDADGNLYETYIQSYNNLEVSFNRSFFRNRFKVVVGAKNLFNNTTLPSTSASQGTAHSGGGDIPIGWGRTLFMKVSYNFSKM